MDKQMFVRILNSEMELAYSLIWWAPAKPVRFVCIEPWQSLPGAENDPQDWNQRAAAACLAPGEAWSTTLSTTFER